MLGGLCVVVFLGIPGKTSSALKAGAESSGKGSVDRAQSLALDAAGNVYVTGYSYGSDSDYDFLTIKYNSMGRRIWTSIYDGPANGSDYASAIALDGADNVFVSGHSNGLNTSLDLTLVKYDKEGAEQWVARYDGPSHRDDYAESMAVAADGSVYVTGYSFGQGTEHDYVTLKVDPQGRQVWAARYNSPLNRDDSAKAVALGISGNIYVMGTDRVRETSYDFATIKYNPRGEQQWLARYHGKEADFDTAQALWVDPEENVYVTGYGYDRKSAYDFVTVKYDKLGKQTWVAIYNGPANRIDEAVALVVDKAGSVFVTGKSFEEGSAFDCVTLKYDTDGNQVWAVKYNGPGNGADIPASLIIDTDSHVILTGYSWGDGTQRDIVTLKYDPHGKLVWESRYNGAGSDEDVPTAMTVDRQGNIYVTGYSYGSDTNYDFLTLKYDPHGNIIWEARYDGQDD
jgi:uncharacterized delta-60 repeat protein